MYSCAYFRDDARHARRGAGRRSSTTSAASSGWHRGERLLDIGCGWGGLLFHAAERYGVDATRHHAVAKPVRARDGARSSRAGLHGRVRVELRDYLDLPEDVLYDKIASVGMFEHVGVRRFPRYFGKIYRVLKPGGMVLNHGITHNSLETDSLGSGIGEFVDEYVFPGGELTHVAKVIEGMGQQGLELHRRRSVARALREDALARGSTASKRARTKRGRKSATSAIASGASTWPARRTRSTAAGCRCGRLLAGKPLRRRTPAASA